MSRPPLTTWLLSDELPGHLNQSLGILRALQRDYTINEVHINLQLKHKILRSAVRWIINRHPALRPYVWRYFYDLKAEGDLNRRPDLIISSGGNTLGANISIASWAQCPNLFSGTAKGYDTTLLRTIFTVTPLRNAPNNVVLDLPPSTVERGSTQLTATNMVALLIGGNGAGYVYKMADWQALIENMRALSTTHGWRWLITSSRRTPPEVEDFLEAHIPLSIIEEAIWFNKQPQKVMKRFLKTADAIFVTEDSLTMVAEAIFSARPVCTLQPRTMRPDQNDADALTSYAQKGFIKRLPMARLAGGLDMPLTAASLPDIDQQISNAIKGILHDQ